MNSDTPRTDALRAKYPFSKSNFFDILSEYQNLERLLIQECKDHFRNVETERGLKSQKRQRIQDLERENQQLRDGLKVCKEALKEIDDDLKENMPEYERLNSANLALSHPAVQGLKD